MVTTNRWIGSPTLPLVGGLIRHQQERKTKLTKQDIINAIQFLERVYVGQSDQDRLFKTMEALKQELARRNKK